MLKSIWMEKKKKLTAVWWNFTTKIINDVIQWCQLNYKYLSFYVLLWLINLIICYQAPKPFYIHNFNLIYLLNFMRCNQIHSAKEIFHSNVLDFFTLFEFHWCQCRCEIIVFRSCQSKQSINMEINRLNDEFKWTNIMMKSFEWKVEKNHSYCCKSSSCYKLLIELNGNKRNSPSAWNWIKFGFMCAM